MGAPGERPHERAEDVVPLDPGAGRHGPGLLLEDGRSGASPDAGARETEGEHAEETGGHLGHDGPEDLGGGVLALPGHVLGLGKEGVGPGREGGSDGRGEGRPRDGAMGDEGRGDGDENDDKEEAEAGHN